MPRLAPLKAQMRFGMIARAARLILPRDDDDRRCKSCPLRARASVMNRGVNWYRTARRANGRLP